MRRFLSYFHPKMPIYLVYMLQQVEYNPSDFFRWIYRFPNLRRVMHRQSLVATPKAMVLIGVGYFLLLFYILGAAYFATFSVVSALAMLVFAPFLTALLLGWVVLLVWLYYEEPKRRAMYRKGSGIMNTHPGLKIAILGSYGKTTMKELVAQTLETTKDVAYTPSNKNVMISHARWIGSLSGKEDVLVMELGEGAPGDISKMAKMLHPDIAIVTGLAPNHLDRYKTVERLAGDILSIGRFVESKHVYYNAEDVELAQRIEQGTGYSSASVLGWQISNISIGFDGTAFTMKKAEKSIKLHTQLLGRHSVGPVAFAAALAIKQGVPTNKIHQAIAHVEPYEHRMQARRLSGAWIIDDTYNGNLEGMLAGLELLKELPAKRKIYVTPGLVDQGQETKRVHTELGKAIADNSPDQVFLMRNSVTSYIVDAMKLHGYKGRLEIVDDPLAYYEGLELRLSKDDVVLLQNDWTDNYY